MTKQVLKATLLGSALSGVFLVSAGAWAQTEGMVPTQTLVRADSKNENLIPDATAITLQLNGKSSALTSIAALPASGVQVALLIDDGLSRSAGVQLNDLKNFANNLPAATEVYVGYMRNGTVETVVPFTTDREEVMSKVRLPLGAPGVSASPYFCLSEFVKHWPGSGAAYSGRGPAEDGGPAARKARFVLMVTNGVDPYNGSTSMMNQDSPNVANAVTDAQKAGVTVSSVYYSDAGFRGRGSLSGQSYLSQMAEGTGGILYNEGSINPVSLTPYFKQYAHDISETYVATFNADAGTRDGLMRLKMSTKVPKLKLRYPEEVRPGNQESGAQ